MKLVIKKTNTRITASIFVMILIFSTCALAIKENNKLEQQESDNSAKFDTLHAEDIPINLIDPIMKKPLVFSSSGFTENRGQLDNESIAYYCNTESGIIYFAPSEIIFAMCTIQDTAVTRFKLSFPGAQSVTPVGHAQQNHYTNYFFDDLQWTNVPTYEEVWFYDLYPSIDLRYYISSEGLKYEFIVHPGADPNLIALQVGLNIRLIIEDQTISFQNPRDEEIFFQDTYIRVYQEDGSTVEAQFVPKNDFLNCYGFHIAFFDPSQILTIDPLILSFSTYLGGNGYEYGNDIAVDAFNSSYIVGETNSLIFPVTPNAYNETYSGDYDIFISKFDATGAGLVFSTYMGGESGDYGYGITLDNYNCTYITGKTASSKFPTTSNAYNRTFGGNYDSYVTKLNATGNGLIFSTFLGGTGEDSGNKIVVDANNNTYITGETTSLNFPTSPSTIDNTHSGGMNDVFVAKLNAAGDDLVYSTYLGGGGEDYSYGIALDAGGNAYITGETWSSNFPTVNAYDSNKWGNTDVFITKLNAAGDDLVYSTYLGGIAEDYGYGITVDADDNAYITGKTISSNFPTHNAYSNYSGSYDAFVTKLNAAGDDLVYSTYLGGEGEDHGYGITLDADGNAYITGKTASLNYPTTPNAYNTTPSGSYDVFVSKLNTLGNDLVFSTYLGGAGEDSGQKIAVDSYNKTYITGYTRSFNFPTYNAYTPTFSGSYDSFVVRLVMDETIPMITLESPTNNTILQSRTLINVTVKDVHLSTVLFNWDGDFNQTWYEPYETYLPSGDRQHRLYVYAKDLAENWVSAEFHFTTDDTSPLIFFVSPGTGTYPEVKVDISGDAEHYWYYIAGIDNDNDTWTTAVTRSIINGTFTLHAYGNDSVDNTAHISIQFTINTTFAAVYIDSPKNTSYSTNNITIELSGDAEHYWYHIWETNQTWSSTISMIFNDGPYTLHAYGNNSIGNVTYVTVSFTIDTEPPSVAITSPTNRTYTAGRIMIDLSGDATHYWYKIDGYDTVNQTWTQTTTLSLTNGTYVLHVYGNDTAGNEAYTNLTFTIDTTLTTIGIVSPTHMIYSTGVISVEFSGDALFYGYYIDGVDSANMTWTSPISRTLLDGIYTLYAYGLKSIGKETYVNITFTIDTTPPALTIDSPVNMTITTGNITIELSGDAKHYWYYIEGSDDTNQTWTEAITRTLVDGTYTLYAFGNDSAGNIEYRSVTFNMETPITTIPTTTPTTNTTTLTTSEPTTTTTTSQPGSLSGVLTVLLFFVTLTVFSRRRKKK